MLNLIAKTGTHRRTNKNGSYCWFICCRLFSNSSTLISSRVLLTALPFFFFLLLFFDFAEAVPSSVSVGSTGDEDWVSLADGSSSSSLRALKGLAAVLDVDFFFLFFFFLLDFVATGAGYNLAK